MAQAMATSVGGWVRVGDRFPQRKINLGKRGASPKCAKPTNLSTRRLSRAGSSCLRGGAAARRAANLSRTLAVTAVESSLKDFKDGDVLYSVTNQDQPMWLEVQVSGGSSGSLYATSGGYELRLDQEGENIEAELLGPVGLPSEFYQRLSDTLDMDAVNAVKEILKVKDLAKGSKVPLKDAGLKYSHRQLCDDVTNNVSQWVDGVGEVEASVLDVALSEAVGQAGEIMALLQGKRGVVLVQLWTMKDKEVSGAVYNPLAIRAFRQAALDSEVDVRLSLATMPDGTALGLTAIFAAKKAPYDAWGERLSSMGVQSALVADTAQHKVMIGTMLGYSEPNIMHHLQSKGQAWDAEMQTAHENMMTEISAVSPSLPWRDPTTKLVSATGVVTSAKVPSQTGFGAAKKPDAKKKGKKAKR